jgi:hypothetical protein
MIGVLVGLEGRLNAAFDGRIATWTASPSSREERYEVATPRYIPCPERDDSWRME